MKEKALLKIFNDIDEKYIEEAVPIGKARRTDKKIILIRWGTAAACLCLALIGAVTFLKPGTSNQPAGTSGTTQELSGPTEENYLYYSKLVDADNTVNKDIFEQFAAHEADIAAFDESMLENCVAVIEGEIVNIHPKNYSFTTADDKFGEGGTLDYKVSTVVYEIKVAKAWYGEMKAGDTVTVEDQLFFADEILAIKKGHSYVIPICEAGNEIWSFNHKELLSGDIQRDSIYGTVYPYHPQIEAIAGGYIVSTDWETLTAGEKSDIIIDMELGENGDFYKDKMKLIPAETFSRQMDILIERIS